MRGRGLILLAALTLALVGIAGALIWRETASPHSGPEDHAPLLPDLSAHLSEITAIDIGDAVYLRKHGDAWILPQKANYPADPAAVNDLLSALSSLVVVEQKTSDPTRYGELGLGEPGSTAPGMQVRLMNSDGKELATIIVGRTAPSLGRVGGGTYVRTGGDARTWLVQGVIRAPADPLAFADAGLFGLDDPKAIKAVTVQAGKTSFALSRPKPEDGFAINGGAPHPDPDKVQPLAGLPVGLTFQDVRLSGTDKVQKTLTFQRFDGVKYILTVVQMDKQLWVRASEDGPDAKAFNESHAPFAFRLPDYRLTAMKLSSEALSDTAQARGGRK